MAVDISNVLHVLAHELRGPMGVAQGYLRMLLEDRLADPADRRRALEQTQRALARVSELSHESTRLAVWFESERGKDEPAPLDAFLERVATATVIEPPLIVRSTDATANATIATFDRAALAGAVVAIVKATARELRNTPCVLSVGTTSSGSVDLLIGAADQLPAVGEGPDTAAAGPLSLERGGLGLSLVLAAAVLDAHGANSWTVNGARTTVGIRLRLEERARQ